MKQEIERKFLIKDDSWGTIPLSGVDIEQAYFFSDATKSIRVRISGEEAFITIKGKSGTNSISRPEYEYKIPKIDARFLIDHLCEPGRIYKTRYYISFGKHLWEVDVFHDQNDGLVVAEIELDSEDESFKKPSWVGEEISYDKRYTNGSLARNPYKNWQ